MVSEASVFLVIGAAATVTYFVRAGGLLLAGYLPKSGKFKQFMNALPGTILLSLIVPAVLSAGIVGWIATACTALCSLKTGNVFASMVLGVSLVALGRWWGW